MSDYGNRADGTKKGAGYFGELKRPDGSVSTELSIGVGFDDGEHEIPMLVPTLSRSEINHLLNGGDPTPEIVKKSVAHARSRMAAGRGVFADDDDKPVEPPAETDQEAFERAWREME